MFLSDPGAAPSSPDSFAAMNPAITTKNTAKPLRSARWFTRAFSERPTKLPTAPKPMNSPTVAQSTLSPMVPITSNCL